MCTDEQFDFPIGTRVGDRYVLSEEIGRGGHAVVYLVHDQHFSSPPVERALKFFKITKDTADWRCERFLEESSRLAPMSHPGLVKVMDRGVHDGFLYFVMEYLGRRTLRSILKESPSGVSVDVALKIIEELGAVLVALHEQNLYHCDLKPANVMLCAHGGGGNQVKVIDLGIARLIDPLRVENPLFPAEGTPRYMAPEQFGATADWSRISAATDIYALAIMAYEMLTGVHPFQDDALTFHNRSHLIPASEVRPVLSSTVDAILLKALADVPSERYQNAAEFAKRLKAAVEMKPVPVRSAINKAKSPGPILVLAADSDSDQQVAVELVSAFTAKGFHASHNGIALGLDVAEALEEDLQASRLVVALVSRESLVDAVWVTLVTQAFASGKAKRPLLVFVALEDGLPIPQEWRAVKSARWRPAAGSELVLELVEESPTPSTLILVENSSHESPLGPLHDRHRLYVEREADMRFLKAVRDRQPTVLVNGPRQFGKTSLLLRGQALAERSGFRVVKSNCKALDHDQFTSLKMFYLALARDFAHQLKLSRMLHETWDDFTYANENFREYLLDHVLSANSHLLWILDGADRIFRCPFPGDVFSMLRSWHGAKEWNRLTLAIGYVTETRRLIDPKSQSPFNVGILCQLESFTLGQVRDLNRRHGMPLKEETEIVQFCKYIGGVPALTQQGLQYLAQEKTKGWHELRQVAVLSIGPFGHHLWGLAKMIHGNSRMRDGLIKILQNEVALTEDEFYELWASGLVSGAEPADARISCELYEDFFRRELGLASRQRKPRIGAQTLLARFRKRL